MWPHLASFVRLFSDLTLYLGKICSKDLETSPNFERHFFKTSKNKCEVTVDILFIFLLTRSWTPSRFSLTRVPPVAHCITVNLYPIEFPKNFSNNKKYTIFCYFFFIAINIFVYLFYRPCCALLLFYFNKILGRRDTLLASVGELLSFYLSLNLFGARILIIVITNFLFFIQDIHK